MADYEEYKTLLSELRYIVENNKSLNRRVMDKSFVDNLNLGYLVSDLRDNAGALTKIQQNAMIKAIDKTYTDVVEAEANRSRNARPTKEQYYDSEDSESDDSSESSGQSSSSEYYGSSSESDSEPSRNQKKR